MAAVATVFPVFGQEPAVQGVVRKAVPERLVVLTFDDSCVSHAKGVAPLLKEYGFRATFYVCGPEAFKDGQNWDRKQYMSEADLATLQKDGFEVGNHTMLHKAGNMSHFTDLEKYLASFGVPKPTTMCWPVYAVRPQLVPELTKEGYLFGRGGHERVYRPEADHPMDVPSFTLKQQVKMEAFTDMVRQATGGRVVVLTFHGVPDLQHPWVNLEPDYFKRMMEYLKRNRYKAIAMRDLAEYINMDKARQLPMTAKDAKDAAPAKLLEDLPPEGE